MEKPKIYVTNAGLGYQQYAWLIRLDKSKLGHNYLCIAKQNCPANDSYNLGEIVDDLEEFYVEEVEFDFKDSPLTGNFLFEEFLITYPERYGN